MFRKSESRICYNINTCWFPLFLNSRATTKPAGFYFGATVRKLIVITEDYHRSGIYEIVNDKGFHKYVGQSMDITYRWKSHLGDLRRNKHGNAYLQNAFNKHGERHFSFAVIEFCKPGELLEREQYWIDKLKPEYNIVRDVLHWSMNFEDKIERHEPEYYQDEDYGFKRPVWHKWVYGGQKRE